MKDVLTVEQAWRLRKHGFTLPVSKCYKPAALGELAKRYIELMTEIYEVDKQLEQLAKCKAEKKTS